MDVLEVPEIRQLPELSTNEESPIAFADMMLTSLLGYEVAVLCAEYSPLDTSVSWRIEPQETNGEKYELEIGISPSHDSFRSVLARYGHHYMNDQLCNGYSLRFLRQRGRIHRCNFYLSNSNQSGFWIRIYAKMI